MLFRSADVFNKRKVLIATKCFEIGAMLLALGAFFAGRVEVMLGVLFLTSVQATFFSPVKYGIVPEMLPDRDLSRANGLLEMSTFVAIILGASLGGFLLEIWRGTPHRVGYLLVAIAVIGTWSSLHIDRKSVV